jgi:2-(1,2-epoxy-1,2-dihydrophenyl)acetyl-CoA isomerase
MQTNANLNMEDEQFSSSIQDGILIIRQKQHILHLATSLSKVFSFYEYLDLMLTNKTAKALVLFGYPGDDDQRHYGKFLCNSFDDIRENALMDRLINLVNNLFISLASMNNLNVFAGRGNISLFHLNLSLAYDYRIVADDVVFENLNAGIGLITKGSGYFLPRLLGVRKATEVLQWLSFSAEDALELGLVDRVVPAARLEEETMEFVTSKTTQAVSLRQGIRKLLKCDVEELRRSLAMEDRLIKERLKSPDFRDALSAYCQKNFGCCANALRDK